MGALGAAAAALAKQASWLPARQQRIRFDLGSATRGLQNLVVFGQTPALQLQEAALFACHSLSKRPEASPSVWQPLSRNPDVLQNSWARGMSTWRGFAAAPLKAAHAHQVVSMGRKSAAAGHLHLTLMSSHGGLQRSGFTTIPPKPPVGMSKMAFYVTEYGLAFSIWWTTAWIISGFGVYALISSGAVGGADAIGLLKAVGIDKLIDVDGIDPRLGNMAITIAINEVSCLYAKLF